MAVVGFDLCPGRRFCPGDRRLYRHDGLRRPQQAARAGGGRRAAAGQGPAARRDKAAPHQRLIFLLLAYDVLWLAATVVLGGYELEYSRYGEPDMISIAVLPMTILTLLFNFGLYAFCFSNAKEDIAPFSIKALRNAGLVAFGLVMVMITIDRNFDLPNMAWTYMVAPDPGDAPTRIRVHQGAGAPQARRLKRARAARRALGAVTFVINAPGGVSGAFLCTFQAKYARKGLTSTARWLTMYAQFTGRAGMR